MVTEMVWFRRDLRVHDHEPLTAAGGADALLCVFVLDPRLLDSGRMSPARLVYLCAALADLDAALHAAGNRLVVRRGDPVSVVVALAEEVSARVVRWSADHTTYAQARDTGVTAALRAAGVDVHTHEGVAIQPPGEVLTQAGGTYRVFTPFHAAWRRRPVGDPLAPPDALPAPPSHVDGDPLPTPGDLGVEQAPPVAEGGERAARRRLEDFLQGSVEEYADRRDLLALDGTSRLSADLHYGCLSPREAYRRLDRRRTGHDAFGTELAWRDFYLHVMARWPEVRDCEHDSSFRGIPWRGESADVAAWREGRTGYPIVDAAMRQLTAEAWMHNRARMIVASFLCKDLLADWRLGQAHFLAHLVDADVASNNGGWQWAAGTGTDAQPFFRIFNPVTQGQRFDPDGDYVRRYVPELASVPTRWIHEPWEMPEDVATSAGVRIGEDYPAPIVDHAQARAEALAFFEAHRR